MSEFLRRGSEPIDPGRCFDLEPATGYRGVLVGHHARQAHEMTRRYWQSRLALHDALMAVAGLFGRARFYDRNLAARVYDWLMALNSWVARHEERRLHTRLLALSLVAVREG